MDTKLFHRHAAQALEHLDQALGDLEHEDLDVQLAGDVLTLTFRGGDRYVINAHSAAGQIWMAAGTTAWHFDYDDPRGRWIATRTDDELMATVARLVGERLSLPITL
jgi:CyaY protein